MGNWRQLVWQMMCIFAAQRENPLPFQPAALRVSSTQVPQSSIKESQKLKALSVLIQPKLCGLFYASVKYSLPQKQGKFESSIPRFSCFPSCLLKDVAEVNMQKGVEVERWRSGGIAFYIWPFIFLLPSVIRNSRENQLSKTYRSKPILLKNQLRHRRMKKYGKVLLRRSKRSKRNYSGTKEFNCIVPAPK